MIPVLLYWLLGAALALLAFALAPLWLFPVLHPIFERMDRKRRAE